MTTKPGAVEEVNTPAVGMRMGRRVFVLEGFVCHETFRYGTFAGWHNDANPVIEYPDGSREVLHSLTETDWHR